MISKSRRGVLRQVLLDHPMEEKLGGRAKSGKRQIKRKPRAAYLQLLPLNHLPAQSYLHANQLLRSVMEVVSVEN